MFIYIHILSYYKLSFYFNPCLSVMLDSLSCSFTSISFLTKCLLILLKNVLYVKIKSHFLFVWTDTRTSSCYMEYSRGLCTSPILGNYLKSTCCCSLGKAWGSPCKQCPRKGTGIIQSKITLTMTTVLWYFLKWIMLFSNILIHLLCLFDKTFTRRYEIALWK